MTISEEFFPASARVQKLEKEDQLTFSGNRGLVISLGIEAASGSIQRPCASREFLGFL